MQIHQTFTLINDLQQQTEDFLQKAVSQWQMLEPAKLLQPPGAKKWSAAQCLEHLNSYGHHYLPAIAKAVDAARENSWEAKELYKPGWLGDYFTNMMLPGTNGKKMKKMSAPKNHTPIVDLDSDKVVREFIDQQEKMLQLLEQARKVDLQKAEVPISIAKFIKLQWGDVFRFLIAHNYRHILQAERALSAVSASGDSKPILGEGKYAAAPL